MTSWLRPRTGVFPGETTEPVDVRDVIVEGVIVGSFYHLDQDRWEFLGPWGDEPRILVDSEEDRLKRCDQTFWLYTDGASRGDPVKAAIGAVLYDPQGQKVGSLSCAIGPATNNHAEYRAFIGGLRMALERNVQCLVVRTDSKLVVNQVRGIFKVKAEKLKPLHREACELLSLFPRSHVEHVPRRYNRAADKKAEAALSGASECYQRSDGLMKEEDNR